MNVLIVDDDRVFSTMVGKHLRQAGFNPLVAFDGMQAMMMARRKELCAVFLDLHMPGGHGFEVLRWLKSSMRTYDVPVIILSTTISEVTHNEAKALGASAVFQKPLNFDVLIKAMKEAMESLAKPSAESDSAAAAKKDTSVKTILVADDDRVLVRMLSQWLKQLGYATFAAYDVSEALRITAMQRVNAVILDLDMPGAHGSAVIQKMKAFNRTSSIPILILSGSDDPDEIQEMLKMGADEFLEKPTDLARVEQALDALVTKAAMRQSGVLNLALATGGKLATNPA